MGFSKRDCKPKSSSVVRGGIQTSEIDYERSERTDRHDIEIERSDGTSRELLECVFGVARLERLGDDANDL